MQNMHTKIDVLAEVVCVWFYAYSSANSALCRIGFVKNWEEEGCPQGLLVQKEVMLQNKKKGGEMLMKCVNT